MSKDSANLARYDVDYHYIGAKYENSRTVIVDLNDLDGDLEQHVRKVCAVADTGRRSLYELVSIDRLETIS